MVTKYYKHISIFNIIMIFLKRLDLLSNMDYLYELHHYKRSKYFPILPTLMYYLIITDPK